MTLTCDGLCRTARDALLRDFPSVSEEVRKLALESGGYDLERTRSVLESMVEGRGSSAATVTDAAPVSAHTRSVTCHPASALVACSVRRSLNDAVTSGSGCLFSTPNMIPMITRYNISLEPRRSVSLSNFIMTRRVQLF